MKPRIIISVLLALTIFLGISTWGADLTIHVINVGQGDSFLIVSPTGKKILIDAGNNGKRTGNVLPYLSSLSITSLHYVFASHYHADHVGGLDEVVSGLRGKLLNYKRCI